MKNLQVTRPAFESERPTKKQKKLNYPDKMHLVLKLVYMHILQQRLVKHKFTSHNEDIGYVDQIYDTKYTYSPDVLRTGSVCKETRTMLEEYGVSEIQRILSNKFTWMKIIKDGVNLCYSSTYIKQHYSEQPHSSDLPFYPMHAWMSNFNFVRHTLSFRGETFGTLHVTRISNKDKSNRLVARLTISASDDLKPFVVEAHNMCFEESTNDSDEDFDASGFLAWQSKQNIDINNYVVRQAIHFFNSQ